METHDAFAVAGAPGSGAIERGWLGIADDITETGLVGTGCPVGFVADDEFDGADDFADPDDADDPDDAGEPEAADDAHAPAWPRIRRMLIAGALAGLALATLPAQRMFDGVVAALSDSDAELRVPAPPLPVRAGTNLRPVAEPAGPGGRRRSAQEVPAATRG